MPRDPKPYLYRGWYRTDAGGFPKHKLCKEARGIVEAKRQLRLYLTELENNREKFTSSMPRQDGFLSVEEAVQRFLEFKEGEVSSNTFEFYQDRLRPFIFQFGPRPVLSLTEQDGTRFKKYLAAEHVWKRGKKAVFKGVSPGTIGHIFNCTRLLFRWLMEIDLLPKNPWSRLSWEKVRQRKRLVLPEEFQAMIELEIFEHFRLMLYLLRCMPFRPSEVRMLDWSWLDWQNHQVVIPPNVDKVRKGRTLNLVEPVESLLLARWENFKRPAEGYAFAVGHHGNCYDRGSFTKRWAKLVKKAVAAGRIQALKHGEHLVMYNARHTRITELVAYGLNVGAVQQEAGHASYQTTQRYVHLASSDTAKAIRAALPAVSAPGVVLPTSEDQRKQSDKQDDQAQKH
jgi:integrase